MRPAAPLEEQAFARAVDDLVAYAQGVTDPPDRRYIAEAVAQVRSRDFDRIPADSAADVVRLLIDLGWRPHTWEPKAVLPTTSGSARETPQVDREALVTVATKAIREAHGPAPEDHCCTYADTYGARATDAILAALTPLALGSLAALTPDGGDTEYGVRHSPGGCPRPDVADEGWQLPLPPADEPESVATP